MIIMAPDNASKKFKSGLPGSPIFPSVIPSTVANTTRPRILVPLSVDGFIAQVYLSSVKK